MRLQVIQPDNTFKEFVEIPFQTDHAEKVLEQWLEKNPQSILEDSNLLIIGRQVKTNLGTFIDLLGLDQSGDAVVVELKRDVTPRETLAQALEYASFIESLDADEVENLFQKYSGEEVSLSEYHREYFDLNADEAIAFNKEQRVVLVGQNITPEIRQTSTFLRRKGLRVTCLEFTFFEADGGQQLLSSEIVVGKEPIKKGEVETQSKRRITKAEFLDALDANGRSFFESLFEFAKERSWAFVWGTSGFSMNVVMGDQRVVLCFGFRPQSVYGQTIYTDLFRRGGVLTKTSAPVEIAEGLHAELAETGLVQPANKELKVIVDRSYKADEMDEIKSWFVKLEEAILEHGLAD